MATTVQELINYLNDIEDKQQPVMYQYYLAEHFSTTTEIFEKVATEYDSELPVDSYTRSGIGDAIAEHTQKCDCPYCDCEIVDDYVNGDTAEGTCEKCFRECFPEPEGGE